MVFQLLIILCQGMLGSAPASAAQMESPNQAYSIVANHRFPVSTMTLAEARRIYLGEKLFIRGVRLRPIEPRDEAIRAFFLNKVMGMTNDEYKSYWLSKIFRDGVPPPESMDSTQMVSTIAKSKGRLGIVLLQEAANPQLIVLLAVE